MDWHPAERRRCSFSNVPSGDWELRRSAKNVNGGAGHGVGSLDGEVEDDRGHLLGLHLRIHRRNHPCAAKGRGTVYANQLVFDDEPDRLERLARYLTRAPLGVHTVRTNNDGRVEVRTPPSARDGRHRFTTRPARLDSFPLPTDFAVRPALKQPGNISFLRSSPMRPIPDRGQHVTRFYGAYANRIRKALFKDGSQNLSVRSSPQPEPHPASPATPASRASWARLLPPPSSLRRRGLSRPAQPVPEPFASTIQGRIQIPYVV